MKQILELTEKEAAEFILKGMGLPHGSKVTFVFSEYYTDRMETQKETKLTAVEVVVSK